MDKWELMKARHSVRKYTDKPIEKEVADALQNEIDAINAESGLRFQMFLDEPEAFSGRLAHYGSFRGATDYFVLVGPDGADEKVGYFGERLVLKAQELGLNTCFVALTYSKKKVKAKIEQGEKIYIVVSVGYGETQGVPHKSKPANSVSNLDENSPKWFKDGVEAALLAPTAVNQQKFYFELAGDKVKAIAKKGPCALIDLGIVKYNFELGADRTDCF